MAMSWLSRDFAVESPKAPDDGRSDSGNETT
jgi:hypothetical protein